MQRRGAPGGGGAVAATPGAAQLAPELVEEVPGAARILCAGSRKQLWMRFCCTSTPGESKPIVPSFHDQDEEGRNLGGTLVERLWNLTSAAPDHPTAYLGCDPKAFSCCGKNKAKRLTAQLRPDGPTVQWAPRCNRAPTRPRAPTNPSLSLGCGLATVSSKARRCQLGTVDGARRGNRGRQAQRAQGGPDGAIGPRPGPDGCRLPPTPTTHIFAQRRFPFECGLTDVSSKARRCQLGGGRRNRGPIGPQRCNRAPTSQSGPDLGPVSLANRPRGTQRGTGTFQLLQNLVETSWIVFGTYPIALTTSWRSWNPKPPN